MQTSEGHEFEQNIPKQRNQKESVTVELLLL